MKTPIRKRIRSIISEVLSPAESSFYGINSPEIQFLENRPGFFSKMSQSEITQWCEGNIGPKMGRGYSRLAFEMVGNNDLVFKVSYIGLEGNETNTKEIKNFTEYGFQSTFFPKVFKSDPYKEWYIVEKLNTLMETEEDEEIGRELFDPYVRQNCKTLSNIEGLLRSLLSGDADLEEKYNILETLPGTVSLETNNPEKEIAYYFFDMVATRAWDPGVWEDQFVFEFQRIDVYDYFEGRHKEFLEKVCNIIEKDPWINRLCETVKELGIDWADVGPGNIGINEKGHIKILDISIFEERFADEREGMSSSRSISWGLK